MKKVTKIIAGSLWALPVLAFAQDYAVQTDYLDSMLSGANKLVNNAVVFLIALAVVYFIYNVVKYAMSADEEEKKKSKDQMIWGIIALAVIVSIWGLVGLLQNIFGVGTESLDPNDIKGLTPGANAIR